MKSILNDINRLEKAFDLFKNLTNHANILNERLGGQAFTEANYTALLGFNLALKTANAFLEKYGSNSQKPDPSNQHPDPS
jgi:hypothetical protein